MREHPTIYIDLDGTLLGKNASLLHDGAGNHSTASVDALFKAESFGADLVVATGRDVYRTSEFCRSIGVTKYIAELGCVLRTTSQEVIEYGAKAREFIEKENLDSAGFLSCVSDAALLLVKHFEHKLELHNPYNRDRHASFLLRGNVPSIQANNFLAENGFDFLELVANGHGMFRRTMPQVDNVLIYHLTPIGVTKAAGIATDQKLRGISKHNSFMIGDGLADAQCHEVVNTVYLPSNGPASDDTLGDLAKTHDNIVILDQSHNLGFAQAIDAILTKYS